MTAMWIAARHVAACLRGAPRRHLTAAAGRRHLTAAASKPRRALSKSDIHKGRDMSGQKIERSRSSRIPKQALPLLALMGGLGLVTLWFGVRQLLQNPDVTYTRSDRRLALRDNRDEGERFAAHRADRGVGGATDAERQRRLKTISVTSVWSEKLGLGGGGEKEEGEQRREEPSK